ncbi:Dystonin, partial [Ophiophagus hannah]
MGFLPPRFGDSQQLRLVRILRSTVMVRVGGGWMALDEFLVKNDPCRGRRCLCFSAKVFPGKPPGQATAKERRLGSCSGEPRELRKMSPGGLAQHWAREHRGGRPQRGSAFPGQAGSKAPEPFAL